LSTLHSKLSARPRHGPRSRDSLLRGIKHELRTPLNAILGFADLLLGELDGPLGADARENVQMVRESGELLLSLINDVLDLATALVQPSPLYLEEVDVVALLEQVRAELERRRGKRLVYLRVISSFDSLELQLDQRLLERALRCLGDVALARTQAGEVALGVEQSAAGLDLWVKGDGFRAAGASLPALLTTEPQPRDRTERMARLKLAIARQLLLRHGGSLNVGTIEEQPALCVCVPLMAADAPALPSPETGDADVALGLAYIAAMSHDLRTPLNAILGFSDLLSLDKRRAWTPAQQRSCMIVHERAVDLAALVDDMIDWAKLEAGELTLKLEPIRVSALVEQAHSAALQRSGARGLQLSVHVTPDSDVLVHADPARCVQALLGLLDHAIRSNPGPSVQIRVQRRAAFVQIVVDDQGLQIRTEDQQSVFDAFRPSYAPTGQRIAGLQLGPAVARSLLRAHGGDVWFESRPGRGTTFTAALPLPLPNSTDSP
jgi:signal transduction histidine kinase